MRSLLALLACSFALLSASAAISADPPADQVEVRGIVLDESGQPAVGATVTAISEPFEQPSTKTDGQGRFTLQAERKRSQYLKLLASADGGKRQALFARDELKPQPLDAIEVKLGKTREIKVTVVDEKEQPIAGASAVAVASHSKLDEQPTGAKGEATLVVPEGVTLQYVYALKPKVGLDYYYFRQAYQKDQTNPYWLEQDHAKPLQFTLRGIQPVKVRVVDDKERPLADAGVHPWYVELPKKGGHFNTLWTYRKTDEKGWVEFDTIPSGNAQKITIWARKERYWAPQRWYFDPANPAEVVARLQPQVLLKGSVRRNDKPAAGATVRILGDGYNGDSFHSDAVCDQDGNFEIYVDDDKAYALMAEGEHECSQLELRVVTAGRKIKPIELALEPATRVFGVLRGIKGDNPLAGEYLMLQMTEGDNYYKLPKDERLPDKGSNTSITLRHTRNARTDDQGRFEFYAGRGNYYLWNDNVEAAQFVLDGQKELEVNLQTKRPKETSFTGKVVLKADPKRTVGETPIDGVPLEYDAGLRKFGAVTLANGTFKGQRSPAEMVLVARTADQLLGGVLKVSPDDVRGIIALEPTATVRGRLIDDETGKALPEQQVDYSFEVRFPKGDDGKPSISSTSYSYGNLFGSTTTDASGGFVLSGLVVGGTYRLQVVTKRGPEGLPREHAMLSSVIPERPDVIELGDVRLIKPMGFTPPTRDELIEKAMTAQPLYIKGRLTTPTVEERLKLKLHDAKLFDQQVLALITPKGSPVCKHFFELYYGTEVGAAETLREKTNNFNLFALDITPGKPIDDARKTLESLKIPLPEEDAATFAILDQDGKLVAAAASGDLLDKDEHLDMETLLEFVNKHARALPDAEKLLTDALAAAKKDDKRVLVQVSGAFCAPCVLLSRYLDEQKALIAKDYVVVKLDDRFVNGPQTIKRVRTEAGGIPWTVILDASGKQLITSTAKSGNIGFPSTPEGIEHFAKMLSATAQRLTKEEIGKLVEALGSRAKD
jgi:hypothetical protein